MEESNEPVFPCSNCQRRFIKSSLQKHESACRKLSQLHRKPFDSGKQRASGSDVTYADVKKAQQEKNKNGGVFPRPQTNWRERHGNFIDAVSSSKRVDYALKTGAPLPPPPRTAVPSDYVQCEYCGRNFSAHAAERHIPFCREQTSRKRGGSGIKPLGAKLPSPIGIKPLPSRGENRSASTASRSGSAERAPVTRGRDGSLSRGRNESAHDLNSRRKSTGTNRSIVGTAHSGSRNSSQSAGARNNLPPATPGKRSTASATKSPGPHRLQTPAPSKSPASRSRKRDESSESRLSQAKANSRNSSRSRLF